MNLVTRGLGRTNRLVTAGLGNFGVTLTQPDTGPLGGARFPTPSLRLDINRARSRRKERLERILESVTEPTREVIEVAQEIGQIDLGELEARIEEARDLLREQAEFESGQARARLEALARDGAVTFDVTPDEIIRDDRNLRLLLLLGC